MLEVKEGTILVAHPQLRDPSFAKSVILILIYRYSEELDTSGVMGVNIAVAPSQDGSYPSGPFALPGPMVLHNSNQASQVPSRPIGDTGYSATGSRSRDAKLLAQKDTIVLTGFAGWDIDQLEDEMAMGAWSPTTTTLQALLEVPSEQRWNLALQGTSFAAPEQ